jgi:hypothetical protein
VIVLAGIGVLLAIAAVALLAAAGSPSAFGLLVVAAFLVVLFALGPRRRR